MTDRPDFGQSKPFERRHEETKGNFVNVRLNDKERAQLSELMTTWRMDNDSTTMKMAVEFAHHVSQTFFKGTLGILLFTQTCPARTKMKGIIAVCVTDLCNNRHKASRVCAKQVKRGVLLW